MRDHSATLLVHLGLGVALGMALLRLEPWFNPTVLEAEVIVESEAAVVEAERLMRRNPL